MSSQPLAKRPRLSGESKNLTRCRSVSSKRRVQGAFRFLDLPIEIQYHILSLVLTPVDELISKFFHRFVNLIPRYQNSPLSTPSLRPLSQSLLYTPQITLHGLSLSDLSIPGDITRTTWVREHLSQIRKLKIRLSILEPNKGFNGKWIVFRDVLPCVKDVEVLVMERDCGMVEGDGGGLTKGMGVRGRRRTTGGGGGQGDWKVQEVDDSGLIGLREFLREMKSDLLDRRRRQRSQRIFDGAPYEAQVDQDAEQEADFIERDEEDDEQITFRLRFVDEEPERLVQGDELDAWIEQG